jgi:hypothetical protein
MNLALVKSLNQRWVVCLSSVALASALAATHARAHNDNPSAASSALSMLPIAVSVVAPVALLSAGAVLTVVAVDASAQGTAWVLERASDGARLSLNLAGRASIGLGALVVVTAVSTGWVLSQAGKAVLFVPNEVGAALLYNEQVTR